jgi:eukaryotic-like serine/threonine-protein kinase
MTGTTVGHYEILERIGEGGMGVVYKGRDLLLNRTLALKFLPPDNAAVDDSRRRMVHEARAASALNHPNIVTVYEVAHADGRPYIAMEFVEGRSLDEVIGGRPLPLRTALDYGIQVANALSAAHTAGIVHRDLKPGNVMVTESGLVKVLDFGLAKIVAIPAAAADATQSVLESPKTVDGLILGSVSYMSPEQAEGRPVDHRSDIFSFGVLMYEMLTGRRAFEGNSAVSTLSNILTAEPPLLSAAASGVPPDLVRIVGHCLRKAAAERWQNIADVRIALEDVKSDLDAGRSAASGAPVRQSSMRWMPLAAALIATAAIAGAAAWLIKPAAIAPEQWRLRRLTADAGTSMLPAISPDGKLVAYVSDRASGDSMDLWVQQIEGGDPVQLTRDLGLCTDPAFSSDGSRIVLRCGDSTGSIYVVSTLGGLPRKLGEGELPQFSPDGSRVAFLTPAPGNAPSRTIRIVRADGSSSTDITIAKTLFGGPVWSPDGRGLFVVGFSNSSESDRDWYFASADNGALTPTGALARLQTMGGGFNTRISVAPDGLLFVQGSFESSSIFRMPFDRAFRKASGDPVPIVVGPGLYFSPTSSQDGRRVTFTIATNVSTNIWRARIDPTTGMVAGDPVRVTSGLESNRTPSPSSDGRHLAYLGGPGAAPEVRLRDLETGKDARLAIAKNWSLVTQSPDGSTVAFNSDARDGSAIYTVPVTGGVPKKVCASCGRPVEWSPDRSRIYFDSAGPDQREIHVLDVATGQRHPFLQHREASLTMPRLSPDGRYVAFTMVRPGRARRIYVAPLGDGPIPEQQWTVVVDGSDFDRQPFWAPSGSLIYFLSERDGFRCVWAQRIDPATRRAVGQPFGAHHMHQTRYSLQAIPDVATIGLSIAGDQLFYASFEMQANVWLAERRQ